MCVHRLVTVPGCCVYIHMYCTPRATATHNSTSQFAVERFLGLYHDAPGGVRFLLLYEVKPFWLRSLSGLQIKSKMNVYMYILSEPFGCI